MKKALIFILATISLAVNMPPPADPYQILEKVDANMQAKTRIIESKMVIHGRRRSREVTSKSWSEGNDRSFTEYISPAREAGTKMLKLEDRLWIYTPTSDRIIQLSGHLLRQSVMGSDLSYEDMMENRALKETYTATIIGEEVLEDRKMWMLELTAKVEDIAYHKRKVWIDQERYVPLKEELYAKSGQLLKQTTLSKVEKVEGRWFPTVMNYKDMLKDGKGTEFHILSIQFDQEIPAHLLSKASLKK